MKTICNHHSVIVCISFCVKWLAILLTRIISEKNLPKSWIIAKTVAIPKPGKDPKMASSYRPISLLSMCYKLLERIILHRISPAVDEILNIEQAGFRPGRSNTGPSSSPYHLRRKWLSTTRQNRSCLPGLDCRIRHCVAQRYVSKTIQSSTMLGRQCH